MKNRNNNRFTQKSFGWLFTVLLISALIAGCGSAPAQPTATLPPTDTPVPTATNTPQPTDTPAPTATNTPLPTATATNTPTATQDLGATATAEATRVLGALIQDIDKELQTVGLSTKVGKLGWVQSEANTIKVRDYNTYIVDPLDKDNSYSDFILRVDITWDSTSGLAGCGLIFRSGDDIINSKQYQFNTIRLSGYPGWDVELWDFGKWKSTVTGDVRASSAINLQSGSTNEYLVIVKGPTATFYGNGKKIGDVTVSSISTGKTGLIAWQESGATTCTFENAWIWDLKK
jgi:hypothetical protein